MTFSKLPRGLQLYIALHVVAMGPALWIAVRQPGGLEPAVLGLVIAAAAVTGTWRISMSVLRGKQSLVFAVVCLAALLQGPTGAILCAGTGALITHLVRSDPQRWWKLRYHREAAHRRLFNVVHCSTVAALAALFQQQTLAALPPEPGMQACGLAVFASVYFVLNTLGVSTAIALDQGENPFSTWRQHYLWMAPGYFACAAWALGFWALYHWLGPASLLLLPVLFLVYVGFRVYAEALTSARALSEEVERLYRREEDANRRKDEFLAMLAHELRNPLAAISNAQYLLENGTVQPARQVSVIGRQTRHLQRLIDDLLDVSRITRGTLALQQETLDFRLALQNVLEATTPMLRARRHQLEVSLDGPLLVHADPARLEQVVTNLLVNAARYSPPESPIWVTLKRDAEAAVCSVRDAGMGIPAKHLERIFELFVRGESLPKQGSEGLGLGLSLVRALVEMHGGTVSARSDGPGCGAEFTVRLPIVPGAEASRPELSDPKMLRAAPQTRAARRVLLVEDNADAAETFVEMLENWGYETLVARTGDEGIALAEREQPEVAILDIGLPDISGYDVARRIRLLPQRPQCIALTGYAGPQDREKALEAGFSYHLSKPANPDEIQRALESLFDRLSA